MNKGIQSPDLMYPQISVFDDTPRQKICKKEPGSHDDSIQNSLFFKIELHQSEQESFNIPTPPHLLSKFDHQIGLFVDDKDTMDIEVIQPHKISNHKQNTDMLGSSDSLYRLPRKDQSDIKSMNHTPMKSGSDTTMLHSYDLFHKMNQNKISVIRHHQNELKNNKTPDFDFDLPLIQEFSPKCQDFKVIIVKEKKQNNQRKALSTGRQDQQSQKRGKYHQMRKQLLTSFQKKIRKQRQRVALSEANVKKNDDYIQIHPQRHQCCSNNDIYSHHQYRAISPEFFETSLSSCSSEQLFVLSASDYKTTTAYLNYQQDTELTNNDVNKFRTASKMKSNTSVHDIQKAISIADNKFSPIHLNGHFYTPAKCKIDHTMEYLDQKHEEPKFFQQGKMKDKVSFQQKKKEESRKINQQTTNKQNKGISNFQDQKQQSQNIQNKSFLRKHLERQSNILKSYLMTQQEMKSKYNEYNSNKYCGSIIKRENLCNFEKLAVSKNEENAYMQRQNQNRLGFNQQNVSQSNRTDRKNHRNQYTQQEFAQKQIMQQKFNGSKWSKDQNSDQKVTTEFIQKVDKNDVGKPMRQENSQNFPHQHPEHHVQRRLDFEGQNHVDESDAYHMQRYREQDHRAEQKKYYQPHMGGGHNGQMKHRQQNQYQGQASPDNQPRGQNLDMRVAGIDTNGYRMSKNDQFAPQNNLNFDNRVRNMHATPDMPQDDMMNNMRTPPYMKHNRQRFDDPRTEGYSGMASFMTQTSSNQQNLTMKGQQVRPVGDFYQAISPFDTRFQNMSANKNGYGCSRFMGRRATPHQQLHNMGYMEHRQNSQRKVMRSAINEQRQHQFSMTPASGMKQTTKNHLRASNSSGENQEPQVGSMQVRPFEDQLMGQRRNSYHERSGHKSGGDTPHHPSMPYRSHTPQRSRMMYQNSTPSYEEEQQDYDLIHDFSNHKMIMPRDQPYRRMRQPSPSYGSFAPKHDTEQEPQDQSRSDENNQSNWSHKQFYECFQNMQAQKALLKTCPMHGEESGYDEYKETMALMTAQAYAYAQSCYLFFQHMINLAKTPEEKHHFQQQLATANKMITGLGAQQDMGIPGLSLPPPALVGVPPYDPMMFVDHEEMDEFDMGESTDSNMETVRTQTQNKNTEVSHPIESQRKVNGFKNEEIESNEHQKNLPKQPNGIDNAPVTKKDKEETNEHILQKKVTVNDCETPDNINKSKTTSQMVTPFTAQVPHEDLQNKQMRERQTENSEIKDNMEMQKAGIRYTQMPPPYQTPAPKVSNFGASGQINRQQMQTQARMEHPQLMGQQPNPFQMRGMNGSYGQPFPNQMRSRMGLPYPPQFMHPQSMMMSASEKRRRNRKCPKTTQFMMQEYIKDPSWCKETYQRVARITGLSDSQVYKWGWDQKNKKAEDGDSDSTLKQQDDQKDSQDNNDTAVKTVQNAIACATISKSDFNFAEENQNGILLPHQMLRDEKKDDGRIAESPAIVLQNSLSENQLTNKYDTMGKQTEATETKSILQKRSLKDISHKQESSLKTQKFKKKRDSKKFANNANENQMNKRHNAENVDPSFQ